MYKKKKKPAQYQFISQSVGHDLKYDNSKSNTDAAQKHYY